MDRNQLKIIPQTDGHEQECQRQKKGYSEAPGAEVPKNPIRKSSRLENKKKLSLSSQLRFRCYQNSSKMMKSSRASLCRENPISENKIQADEDHQFPHRNENNGVLSADTFSIKSSTVVPSFKYHVRATDGIRLVVDLNSKRSDWLKSMEESVCVCYNHSKPAFESFRKEVEDLGDRNYFKVSSFDKTTASDASMNSYVQNNFPVKSLCTENEETLPSVVENKVITVSGLKRRWSKVDQNSELVLENSENTMAQENCRPDVGYREIVALSSEEIQFAEFSSYQKGSLCTRTEKVCSEHLLMSSNEVNQEADGNDRRSTSEIKEKINFAKEMEVFGSEKTAIVISASDEGPKRKTSYHKSDQIHSQSHDRILRSTKLFGGQILERDGIVIRRSSRLHFK